MASSGQWTAKLDGLEVKSGGYTEVRLPEQIDEGWRGAVLGGLGREGEETTAALVKGHTAFNLTFNHDAHLTCQWKRQLLF